MPTLNHHGEIDAEAADWAVRVDADALSPAETARLDAWLEADRRHRGAFARARAVLHAAGQLQPQDARAPRRVMNRRVLIAGGGLMAASVAAGVAVLAGRDPVVRMETGAGETRRLALSDGSTAVLDSRSNLRASLSPEHRRLTLTTGEAWLSTAEDATRPFSLDIGGLRARAVKTSELVLRLRDGQARLTVVRGLVEAWSAASPQAVRHFDSGAELTLGAADRALRVGVLAAGSIERRLGWREGLLILDGETLAETAREFNHYNDRKIEVAGAAASLRVVGAFRNTAPDAFAQAMQNLFGVSVRYAADRIMIADGARSALS